MVVASLRGARGLSWPIKAAPGQHLHTPGYWLLVYYYDPASPTGAVTQLGLTPLQPPPSPGSPGRPGCQVNINTARGDTVQE